MSVIDVAVTFLICIHVYLLRPMFYMYQVTGRNNVVLYIETPNTCFLKTRLLMLYSNIVPCLLLNVSFTVPYRMS